MIDEKACRDRVEFFSRLRVPMQSGTVVPEPSAGGQVMGQREDVTASLIASHGVDGVARRKVADQVREVTEAGARSVAGRPSLSKWAEEGIDQVAMAASAVVLASDLRAPSETRDEFVQRLAELHARGEIQWHFPDRSGWRARLANVERLLAASLDSKTPRQAAETVTDALAEVRAMLDGE